MILTEGLQKEAHKIELNLISRAFNIIGEDLYESTLLRVGLNELQGRGCRDHLLEDLSSYDCLVKVIIAGLDTLNDP